jgi:phosphoserine phosphatase
VGYADSYSDVPMLSAVAHPVATYPDDQLRAYAQQRQWEIFPQS